MQRVSADTEWADRFGYSRAVRRGQIIEVAGTTGLVNGQTVAPDAYSQAKMAFEIVLDAVGRLGGSIEDVVRTRMFVVDIVANGEQVGLAHGEVFGEVKPATAMYEVSALIAPQLLVEVEATAVVI